MIFDFFVDLGSAGENVKQVKMYSFLRKHATGVATTQLHIVQVERGMSWDEAFEKWSELSGPKEGFYLSHQVSVILICVSLSYLFHFFIINVCIVDSKQQTNRNTRCCFGDR